MKEMLYVFLPCIVGGLIQATTGFGNGIFIMLFLPLFLPILKASALSTLVGMGASIMLAIQYRKYIKPKITIVPAIFYCIFAFTAIHLAKGADLSGLKAFFGFFLIVVALYFIFFADKIKIKNNLFTSFICGSISGVASGLFGIGGPPMVIYILAAVGDDKNAYIANTQFFFSMTALYTTTVRIFNGILTPDLLPLVIPGIIGMYLGKNIGVKIVEKIDIVLMKKLIYGFLGISGLITFVTNI